MRTQLAFLSCILFVLIICTIVNKGIRLALDALLVLCLQFSWAPAPNIGLTGGNLQHFAVEWYDVPITQVGCTMLLRGACSRILGAI